MAKALPKQKNNGIPKPVGMIIGAVIAAVFFVVILLHHNPLAVPKEEIIKKAIVVLPRELWDNRELIWKLARNDFKKRYAGSTMGRVWAFVQPVVTVAMYYCVF